MMYESTERLEQGNVLNIRSRTGGGLEINKLLMAVNKAVKQMR